jgi:hypothetical protein
MIDLKPKLDNRSVRELLSFCVGNPTPRKLEAICEQYRTKEAHHLLGIEEDGQVRVSEKVAHQKGRYPIPVKIFDG